MKIYITQISRKLRNLREEKKLTQEELAEKLGISRQSIISVEKGKCLPSLPLALRIADIFELAFDEIFNPHRKNLYSKGGDNNMPQHPTPWMPFDEIDRFFEEDWPASRIPATAKRMAPALPPVNIKQTDTDVIIEADIPGYKDDDVEIEVGDDFVSLKGERKEESEEKKEGYLRREFSYGSFERRIPLPTNVETKKAEAMMKNGLLKITLPKIEAIKPKVTKLKVKKLE